MLECEEQETLKYLQDFKKYVNDFQYDLIIVSSERLTLINQFERKFMQINSNFMMIDILELLITTNTNLKDIFNCATIKFSTDYYLKSYLSDCTQIV